MKKILLVFIIACCAIVLNAQYIIKGKILDISSGKGVPFAIVQFEGFNVGCISDSIGNFVLNNIKNQTDSLLFSCLGYESMRISISDKNYLGQSLQVELKPKLYEIKEVVIKPSNKSFWLGEKKPTYHHYYVPLLYSQQQTRYFKTQQSSSFIKSFWFYLSKTCGLSPKVRICIYDADTIKHLPKDDILRTNLIIGNIKVGWNKVDLSKFSLPIPSTGFFIGLESVAEKSDCCKRKNFEDQYIVSYESMVIGCSKKPSISASKQTFFADYETIGELKPKMMEKPGWMRTNTPNHGFNLLYKVEIAY